MNKGQRRGTICSEKKQQQLLVRMNKEHKRGAIVAITNE